MHLLPGPRHSWQQVHGHTGAVDIPVGWSVVLLATAAWNLLIWPRFWQRIAADPRSRDADGRATKFLTVHSVLIAVSLALALAVGVLGVISLF
jgi:hypothetical protein